jgi:hypothetical protein
LRYRTRTIHNGRLMRLDRIGEVIRRVLIQVINLQICFQSSLLGLK